MSSYKHGITVADWVSVPRNKDLEDTLHPLTDFPADQVRVYRAWPRRLRKHSA